MGRWRVNAGIFKRIWNVCGNDVRAVIGGNWRGLKPLYVDRFILLVVLNISNWSLSGYGLGYMAGNYIFSLLNFTNKIKKNVGLRDFLSFCITKSVNKVLFLSTPHQHRT